jgi:F-type H+-transporting ATPase subunit a
MEIHVELAAETLFHVGPIPITNSLLTMLIVMTLILLVGSVIARRARTIPEGRAQGAFETIVEFLLGLVEGTAGRKAGRRIFPLVGGIFIFIIFANWSGMLPGVGTVGYYHEEAAEEGSQQEGEEVAVPDASDGEGAEDPEARTGREIASIAALPSGVPARAEEEHAGPTLVPFFRAPNADLNMTLAMALLTFTVVQVAGISAHGVAGRIKHMADPPFLFPIELISEFSRIISLSARLFGNVFAGEVLLAVMYAMAAAIRVAIVPFLFPVVFLGLELLFGAIQALVFALLTLIYITLATAGGHGDEAHEAHVEGAHGLGNVLAAAGD